MDLALTTHIVDEINEEHRDLGLKIDNASVRGLNPTINLILEKYDKKEEASKMFRQEFEFKINLLETLVQEKGRLLQESNKRADLAEGQLMMLNSLARGELGRNYNSWGQLSSAMTNLMLDFLKMVEQVSGKQD